MGEVRGILESSRQSLTSAQDGSWGRYEMRRIKEYAALRNAEHKGMWNIKECAALRNAQR